jgi:hypothetical protein
MNTTVLPEAKSPGCSQPATQPDQRPEDRGRAEEAPPPTLMQAPAPQEQTPEETASRNSNIPTKAREARGRRVPRKFLSAPRSEHKQICLGPLTLDFKVGVIALFGLLGGVIGGGYKLYEHFLRGPQTRVIPPQEVYIRYAKFDDATRHGLYTRMMAQLTFANSGERGRDGGVEGAWLEVEIPQQPVTRQEWYNFMEVPEVEDKHLTLKIKQGAARLMVPGDGSVTREISFIPRVAPPCPEEQPKCLEDINYVTARSFYEALNQHPGEFVRVTFHAKTEQGVVSTRCRFKIDPNVLDRLFVEKDRTEEGPWFNPRCRPDSDFPS